MKSTALIGTMLALLCAFLFSVNQSHASEVSLANLNMEVPQFVASDGLTNLGMGIQYEADASVTIHAGSSMSISAFCWELEDIHLLAKKAATGGAPAVTELLLAPGNSCYMSSRSWHVVAGEPHGYFHTPDKYVVQLVAFKNIQTNQEGFTWYVIKRPPEEPEGKDA